jgi:hypothetical protein
MLSRPERANLGGAAFAKLTTDVSICLVYGQENSKPGREKKADPEAQFVEANAFPRVS